MLLEIFHQHNHEMELLIGNGFAEQTYKRYQTTLDHTRSFIKWKSQLNDIDLSKLNFSFISDFEFYLKLVRNCGHNSTIKYLTNFKKIILQCVKKDWLVKDPFTGFRLAVKPVEKPFLDQNELEY